MASAEAVELKNKGNAAFKGHDWPAAVDFYSKAIDKYDQEPSFYSNRAQVSSRLSSGHTTSPESTTDEAHRRPTSNSNLTDMQWPMLPRLST